MFAAVENILPLRARSDRVSKSESARKPHRAGLAGTASIMWGAPHVHSGMHSQQAVFKSSRIPAARLLMARSGKSGVSGFAKSNVARGAARAKARADKLAKASFDRHRKWSLGALKKIMADAKPVLEKLSCSSPQPPSPRPHCAPTPFHCTVVGVEGIQGGSSGHVPGKCLTEE